MCPWLKNLLERPINQLYSVVTNITFKWQSFFWTDHLAFECLQNFIDGFSSSGDYGELYIFCPYFYMGETSGGIAEHSTLQSCLVCFN